MFRKKIATLLLVAVAALTALPVSAQLNLDPCGRFSIPNEFCVDVTSPIQTVDDVVSLLFGIFEFAVVVAGILAVGVILWSGILFMTAGDSEDRRKRAGAWFRYGIIGIIVAIISFTIISLVETLIGLVA